MSVRVGVQAKLLRWAYERAGLDEGEANARFPHLADWSDGALQPTLKQLEAFAKGVNVPIGFLFLSEPPVEKVPLPDFRTIAGRVVARPSPNLLDTIYVCQQRQEWYREHALLQGEQPLGFVGSATTKGDVENTAASIRDALGFGLAERRATSSWTDALRLFIERADQAGVLVMVNGIVGSNTHRKLDPNEFRGFALADRLAPLVFINGADTKAAQMFTLAHEIAHLWLGESALSDVNVASTPSARIEEWCNHVAAELLVPRAAIEKEHQAGSDLPTELDRLARAYRVSTLVVLRRLHDIGALTRPAFSAAYKQELARLMAVVEKSGGGDFYRTEAVRVGKRFARAIIVSTLEGQTLHRDAFRLLGFSKIETLHELGRSLQVA